MMQLLGSLLFTLLVGLYCLIAPMNVNAQNQPIQGESPSQINAREFKQRFDALNNEFTQLTTILLQPSLLDSKQRLEYLTLLSSWQLMLKKSDEIVLISKQELQNDTETELTLCDDVLKYYFVLNNLIEAMKNSFLKLHFLFAALELHGKTIAPRMFHGILVTIYAQQVNQFNKYLTSTDDVSNKQIDASANLHDTSIIKSFLPSGLLASSLSRILGITEYGRLSKQLFQVLDINLYEQSPTIVDTYITFIINYEMTKYSVDQKESESLLVKLELLLTLLYEHRNNTSEPELTLFSTLIIKLLHIKQQLLFSQQLACISQQWPESVDLFCKHNRLIHSSEFIEAYIYLPITEQETLDKCIILIESFFNQNNKSLNFEYELGSLKSQLLHLKTKYMNGALKRWVFGTHQVIIIFDEMLEIIQHIEVMLNHKNKNTNIVSYILSGAWLAESDIKKVSSAPNNGIVIEFAKNLLGNKEFDDLKTAALHTLIYASPNLLNKVIDYLKPNLHQSQLVALESAQQNSEKLLDFANKNPDVFKQLIQAHPEILEHLATSLQDLIQKNH